MDRGERYEDPLLDALDGGVIADVVGGGSQLLPGGNEIEYCCIDLDIFDLDRGVSLITSILSDAGAPKGSFLSYTDGNEKDHKIAFGTTYGIAIYLNGTELPDAVYADCDINYIIETANQLLEGFGHMQSYWEGPTETALYFYGSSTKAMRNGLRGLLADYPLCQRARVVDLPTGLKSGG